MQAVPRPMPGAAPQGPQSGGQQAQQGPSPVQAIQMIQMGFQALMKFVGQAQGQLPPEDLKLVQSAAQQTDAMIQALTGAAQPQQQPQPKQGMAMAMNQRAGSQPSGPQGR